MLSSFTHHPVIPNPFLLLKLKTFEEYPGCSFHRAETKHQYNTEKTTQLFSKMFQKQFNIIFQISHTVIADLCSENLMS